MSWIQNLSLWAEVTLGLTPAGQRRVLLTLLVILLGWLVRRLAVRASDRRLTDIRDRYLWRKRVTYLTVVLTGLVVARIWLEGVHSLATFLGLLSAGLAIALKDLVADLAGWVFILWRRPFEVGDRIQIGDWAGDVINIRLFQFTLLEIGNWVDADQSTGRVIHVPNWKVFSEPQANYTKGFRMIWNEIPVLVTFESDWRAAKGILEGVAFRHTEHLGEDAERRLREASSRYMIFFSVLTPRVYTSVRDSGVLLTIRYLCEPRNRRGSEEAIWEEILEGFAVRPDIDLAYPTYRYYDAHQEGTAARAKPKEP